MRPRSMPAAAPPRRAATPPRPALIFALALPTGAAGAELLVVLAKSDHYAALVDPATHQVVARIPTGRGPHEVAVSPDGGTAYVCNYGAYGLFRDPSERRLEPGNTLTVIDLGRRAARGTFDLGDYTMPHGIAVSRDGARLWVTCEGAQSVLELDARSGERRQAWKTGQEISHMLVPAGDERKLYVTNIGSGSVSVIERASGTVRTLPTGAGAEGLAVSPDGREGWVTNRAANNLSIIDLATDRVSATVESGGAMPIRVQFTPDGRQAWVSNAKSSSVTVFEAATRRPLETIEVGAVPVGIQMSPDGRRAFVACTNDNRIKVLDVPGRRVAGEFSAGNEPDGMAWAAIGR